MDCYNTNRLKTTVYGYLGNAAFSIVWQSTDHNFKVWLPVVQVQAQME